MQRIREIFIGWMIVLVIGFAVYFLIPRPVVVYPQVRAVWVTRFDYKTAKDVQQIVKNVAEAGFTDLFFQIRGNGTVFYRSKLEPWAYELSGKRVENVGKDPGWDPLQVAIDAACLSGLRVHAYMNVLPGWRGTVDPPKKAHQLWTVHPEWFMVDSLGKKMLPTKSWYSFVNPVLPEVREHLRGVVAELCGYRVAGIHLDYIRYPEDYRLVAKERYPSASEDEILRHCDFSYDPMSVGLMKAKYGNRISRSDIVKFRCDSVTRVVKEISFVMQQRRTNCVLSASVFGDPIEGREHAFQDSGKWIRENLIDWAVQMNYSTRFFKRNLRLMKKAAGRRGFARSVVVGLFCENDVQSVLKQMDLVRSSRSRGFALFSYGALFDLKTHKRTKKGDVILKKMASFF